MEKRNRCFETSMNGYMQRNLEENLILGLYLQKVSFVYVCHCLTPHKCFKLSTFSWLTSLLISSLYCPPLTWFCYKGLCCCAYLLVIRACLDKPISHSDWEGLKKKLVHFPFQSTYIGRESVYPSKPNLFLWF